MAADESTSDGGIDPYRELGVERAADQRTIRAAYHAQARLRHPDVGGNAEAMARANAAYDVLRDPRRRAAYDAIASPGTTEERTRWNDARTPPWTGAAGPPPGRPSGPTLTFGIFAGWSLGEIARRDPGYLAWLSERPEGKPYIERIEAILKPLREAARVRPEAAARQGRFRR